MKALRTLLILTTLQELIHASLNKILTKNLNRIGSYAISKSGTNKFIMTAEGRNKIYTYSTNPVNILTDINVVKVATQLADWPGTDKIIVSQEDSRYGVVDLLTGTYSSQNVGGTDIYSVVRISGNLFLFGSKEGDLFKFNVDTSTSLGSYKFSHEGKIYGIDVITASTHAVVFYRSGKNFYSLVDSSDMSVLVAETGSSISAVKAPSFSTSHYYTFEMSSGRLNKVKVSDNTVESFYDKGNANTAYVIQEITGLDYLVFYIGSDNKIYITDGNPNLVNSLTRPGTDFENIAFMAVHDTDLILPLQEGLVILMKFIQFLLSFVELLALQGAS